MGPLVTTKSAVHGRCHGSWLDASTHKGQPRSGVARRPRAKCMQLGAKHQCHLCKAGVAVPGVDARASQAKETAGSGNVRANCSPLKQLVNHEAELPHVDVCTNCRSGLSPFVQARHAGHGNHQLRSPAPCCTRPSCQVGLDVKTVYNMSVGCMTLGALAHHVCLRSAWRSTNTPEIGQRAASPGEGASWSHCRSTPGYWPT